MRRLEDDSPQDPVAPVDPRDVEHAKQGTPVRDAAVDPQPGDWLAPIGAGEADPHGPDVVSPGLHGNEDQATNRPGKVRAAPQPQERDEVAQAQRIPRS